MSDAPLPGVFQLTPLNPEFNDDPHALLDRLRGACPVHRDTEAGTFILTRHEDVRGVLSDTSMWRGPDRAEPEAMIQRAILEQRVEGIRVSDEEARSGILLMDEPDHMRIRGPFAKALYKRVAKCKPLVQRVVDQWLDRVAGKSRFDAMEDFALRVPIDVIARILGVDESRLDEFREWSEGAILGLNPFRSEDDTRRLVTASNALSSYMNELMRRRRRAQGRSRQRHDAAQGGRCRARRRRDLEQSAG